MDADARQRALAVQLPGSRPPSRPAPPASRADDHHLVADRLDDARVVGQRRARPPRRSARPRSTRLLLALPPRSGACSPRGRRRRSRPAGGRGRASPRRGRPPCGRSTSCSTKCRRKRWWTWSMIGEASGSSSRARPSISSAISRPGDAVAHQRLVDVEVEEPHLGVGDLRQRLAVDAHELQEGDEREAGARARRRRSAAAQVVVGELVARRRGKPDRRSGSARSAPARGPISVAPPPRAVCSLRGRREQVLDVARRRAGRRPWPAGSPRASARARAGARRSARGRPRPASSRRGRRGAPRPSAPSGAACPGGRRCWRAASVSGSASFTGGADPAAGPSLG